MLDPDPRMAGASIKLLRSQGVEVVVGVCGEECKNLNQRYLFIREQHRPALAIKAACSLDGRIVSAHGESKWITNQAMRTHAHQLRSIYDGILVGSKTLLIDDPSLNCRIPNGRNPVPILLDSHARCPVEAKVLRAGKRPILCCLPDAPARPELPVDRLEIPKDTQGRLDITILLQELYKKGIYSILIEGGNKVLASFIELEKVDALELFMGNVFLGGGTSWGRGAEQILRTAPRLQLRSMERVNNDVHLSYFWKAFDV